MNGETGIHSRCLPGAKKAPFLY